MHSLTNRNAWLTKSRSFYRILHFYNAITTETNKSAKFEDLMNDLIDKLTARNCKIWECQVPDYYFQFVDGNKGFLPWQTWDMTATMLLTLKTLDFNIVPWKWWCTESFQYNRIHSQKAGRKINQNVFRIKMQIITGSGMVHISYAKTQTTSTSHNSLVIVSNTNKKINGYSLHMNKIGFFRKQYWFEV